METTPSKTKYIDCEIKRPRMVDFLGLPLHRAGLKTGKDEQVTKDMDIGIENDSFKIRVEMADNAGEAGEEEACERTNIMRNIKSIEFSRLAMTKAFVKDCSANVIIKANKPTVTDCSLSGNEGCNSDLSAERCMKIKIEKMERNVDNQTLTMPATDPSAKEKKIRIPNNGINENVHENIDKQANVSKQSENTNKRKSGNTPYNLDNEVKPVPDNGDMNEVIDQQYDDGDDIDVDFGPYSPEVCVMEDSSAPEHIETEKETDRNENNTDTALDGNTNSEIPKSNNDQIQNQRTDDIKTNQTKPGPVISENQDKHHYKMQAGSINQIENSKLKKGAEKRQPGSNQLPALDTTESSVSEGMLDSETQILEIGKESGKESHFKFTVKHKEKRETPIETSSESRQDSKRLRTNSVDAALNIVEPTIQNNESPNQKAKYQIIVAKPERKVFFCDMCNMSVHDMLMHKAKHHWF